MKIYLVGCGKSKRDVPSKAEDLYIGNLVSKSIEYVNYKAFEEGADKYILSAKWGLLDFDKVIEPYDLTLKKMAKKDRQRWARRVAGELRLRGYDLENDEFVILAGKDYSEYLVDFYLKNYKLFFGNLPLGKRGKYIKEKLNEI